MFSGLTAKFSHNGCLPDSLLVLRVSLKAVTFNTSWLSLAACGVGGSVEIKTSYNVKWKVTWRLKSQTAYHLND